MQVSINRQSLEVRNISCMLLPGTTRSGAERMSGVSRVLGVCSRANQSDHTPCSSSSPSARPSLGLPRRSKGDKNSTPLSCQGRMKVTAAIEQTTTIAPEEQKKPHVGIMEFCSSLAARFGLQLQPAIAAARSTSSTLQAAMMVERGVVGCRSFALIAVAGSLIGSILCFVEGCFLVLESYLQYFHAISQRLDQGGIIQLLIEAIDIYLVGTALLTFGMGIYAMFIESNDAQQRSPVAESNLFGLFNLKRLSEGMQMKSITQAKSRIGHAIVLILQAGVVDKFKNVPLTTGLDLACLAGAVLSASASVFLLSKLTPMQRSSKADNKYINGYSRHE